MSNMLTVTDGINLNCLCGVEQQEVVSASQFTWRLDSFDLEYDGVSLLSSWLSMPVFCFHPLICCQLSSQFSMTCIQHCVQRGFNGLTQFRFETQMWIINSRQHMVTSWSSLWPRTFLDFFSQITVQRKAPGLHAFIPNVFISVREMTLYLV